MRSPLADIRVVSLEQYGAGPYGTLHLADLGAEIIKIEQPGQGDVGRGVPPYREGNDSLFFQSLNRNKLGVVLDVRTPEGREVLEDLVRVSDAVFSNMRGDVPAKLRIRYADLEDVNPQVVCCSLTGYGMNGPMQASPGFDYMVQGRAGWMSVTGEPDGPPSKSGLSVVDFSAGLAAALSLMVGVHAARRDGKGGDCDVALLDTAISMLNYMAAWHLTEGFEPARVAQSGHQTLIPFGNFPTSDGWIVAGGSKEKFWVQMCAALGLDSLADDPRYATFDQRMRHRDEVIEHLNTAFRTRTTSEWLDLLPKHGVPCAPVNSVGEALQDEQVVARGLVFRQEHPVFGAVGQVRSPVNFGEWSGPGTTAPVMGQDTYPVLSGLLGYSDARIDSLEAKGIVECAR